MKVFYREVAQILAEEVDGVVSLLSHNEITATIDQALEESTRRLVARGWRPSRCRGYADIVRRAWAEQVPVDMVEEKK